MSRQPVQPSRHRAAGVALALAAACLAAALAAAPAGAASGATTLRLDGPAAKALRAAGVRVAPVRPARGGARRVVLPLAAGLAGTAATLLRQRGAIALTAPRRGGDEASARRGGGGGKAGARRGGGEASTRRGAEADARRGSGGGAARSGAGRRVVLRDLRLLLGRRSQLDAKLGGRRIHLFAVLPGGRRQVRPARGSANLAGLRLKLTPAAARALASRLGLSRLAPGRFATLSARARGLAGGDTGVPSGGGTGRGGSTAGGGGGSGGGGSATCPLPSTAGAPAEPSPPPASPPPGAVNVTGASLDWHVRESFVRYIATGEGTSAVDGATAGPPVLAPGSSVPLSYDFRFPFAGGWLDRGADLASPADDRAAIRFSGGLRFRYSGHGIDLLASNPELELNGGASRAIFAVSDNGAAAERQVLVNLDLGRAAAISQNSGSYTYERVPGAVPSGTAASVFAGFYAPGTDFGCFTVTFSADS